MLGHANGIDESLQQSDRTKNDVLKHRNYIQRLMKHPGERERERGRESLFQVRKCDAEPPNMDLCAEARRLIISTTLDIEVNDRLIAAVEDSIEDYGSSFVKHKVR